MNSKKPRNKFFDPYIIRKTINDNHEFIILMTDGVSDHISNEEAVELVSNYLVVSEGDLKGAMWRLLEMAARNDKRNHVVGDSFELVKLKIKDDMSALIVDLKS